MPLLISERKALSQIPDKFGDFIELAVKDLKKAERSKRLAINMGHWHTTGDYGYDTPRDRERDTKVCTVCFAGAVMACTLKVDHGVDVDSLHGCFGGRVEAILRSLDDLRCGAEYIGSAWDRFCYGVGIGDQVRVAAGKAVADRLDMELGYEYVQYDKSPILFKKWAMKVARRFQEFNL